jgi:thioredoxin-like negative regulator of GroEL
MKKEEQIREAVRKVINQMIDEEFASVMQDVESGKVTLTDRNLDKILADLLKPSKGTSE